LLADAEICLLPWPGDPHPDHQAAGRAAARAAPVTAHRWSYPVWLWHWMRPDDGGIPWARAFRHELTEHQRVRKAAGIEAFVSQLKPGPAGENPILSPAMLTHFQRDTEVLFREPPAGSAPHRRFEELYHGTADPWEVSTSWYERRKRAVSLAALPQETYASAFEPACGIGAFTRELARRCDRLTAFDPVRAAVAQARTATAGLSGVDVRLGTLPDDLPPGAADLIVFSEILYYLGDVDLSATVDRAVSCLRTGGELLAVHWLPWAPEAPRDGMDAHRRLLAHPRLEPGGAPRRGVRPARAQANMISAIGVVVPAHNEEDLIGGCLRALRKALQELPAAVDRAICVVADRCTDATSEPARREFNGWRSGMVVTSGTAGSIGEVRDLGVRRARAALSGHPDCRVLLLCTDADTIVAPDWARRHVNRASRGSHAVAGFAELDGTTPMTPRTALRYRGVLADARQAEGPGNVFGANLGVRADAYTSVGGFRPLHTGEDHDLWHRLGSAGYRLCFAADALVTTSSRLRGRATGGLADLLRSLR
jgi:SAM-dependent methyltransferase